MHYKNILYCLQDGNNALPNHGANRDQGVANGRGGRGVGRRNRRGGLNEIVEQENGERDRDNNVQVEVILSFSHE